MTGPIISALTSVLKAVVAVRIVEDGVETITRDSSSGGCTTQGCDSNPSETTEE